MTIRLKLTVGVVAVVLVANSLLSLVSIEYLQGVWLKEVQTRVRLDLNSARAAYGAYLDRIDAFLRAAALDERLTDALRRNDRGQLAAQLARLKGASGLEMLLVTDATGRVVLRAGPGLSSGDDLSGNALIAETLSTSAPTRGTVALPAEALAREGKELAQRALIALQPTPAARPTDDQLRADGMVLGAAVPIRDREGKLAGVLSGGDLLNRRYALVDAIRQEVFPDETYGDQPKGNVTVFLGDLRIATNVVGADGARAVGTRLSAEVYDEVLQRGQTWARPAFVVNDWYITAYEPIRDPQQRIIGALYVGLLRAPLLERQNALTAMVLSMVLVATLASLALLLFMMAVVLRPIGRVLSMAQRISEGDLSARVGACPPGEMGTLCRAIDRMADAVAQREAQLELAARQQIGRSEQLASIGRLAAGVAHEINNPLTGVLTFAHLMRDKSNMDDQDREDLDLIIHETTRAAEIVRNLLDFARERASIKEPLEINEVVRRTVRLIRNQKSFDRIAIEEELADGLPQVDGDMNQLQQVFLNLALNACEAMPEGGLVTIHSESRDGKVLVRVTDTGCGIKPEHREQIFEPFFTTKPVGKGTGLGLSVSYGILQQHGGSLEFQSEEGRGSTFTVILPAVREEMPLETEPEVEVEG